MSGVWEGNWRERLYERAASLGYGSMNAFAAARQGATYEELATQLGEDVAPIQVTSLLHQEAIESGTLEAFARDCLARFIRERMPAGWSVGEDADFRRARAFGSWSGELGDEWDAATWQVWDALQKASPPRGWLPQNADDPLLVDAFHSVVWARGGRV